MSATERYPEVFTDIALQDRMRLSLHRAKTDYCYPTIWLPHSFSALVGLSTRIYQTLHDGTPALRVVAGLSSSSDTILAVGTWTRKKVTLRHQILNLY